MRRETIHTAYSVSRRFYRAVAVVRVEGSRGHHTRRTGRGDTPYEATAEAIAYILDTYRREGLTAPAAVVEHGRMAALLVDAALFGDA